MKDAPAHAADAATQRIQINEIIFEILRPYSEGHVCGKAEAIALNQVFAENVRNNCNKMVKTTREKAGEAGLTPEAAAELHKAIADYASKYRFAERGQRIAIDPAEKEALKLAAAAYRAALLNKGHDPKSIDKDVFENNVQKLVESRPWYREEAARRIAAASAASADLLDALLSPEAGA